MTPADVPSDLVRTAADVLVPILADMLGQNSAAWGAWERRQAAIVARTVLAAALPLHEQQLRAQRGEWHRQNGLLQGELAELRERLGETKVEFGHGTAPDRVQANLGIGWAKEAARRNYVSVCSRLVGEWRDVVEDDRG